MPQSAYTGTIVHTLWRGRLPCNFTKALPRDWPPGHAWVGHNAADAITCPACKQWAQEFNKKAKGDGNAA